MRSMSNLLMAEDDEDDRELFALALEEAGLTLHRTFVEDGDKLIKQLESITPDVLILDINLPCKNGLDCLELIRDNRRFDNMPVIMYSTSSLPEHIFKAYVHGANLFIAKPASYETIKQMVVKLFEYKKQDIIPQLPFKKFYLQ